MSRQDVEMRFSLHSDCTLVVLLTNAPAIDAEDVAVIEQSLAVHVRALLRIANANAERESPP